MSTETIPPDATMATSANAASAWPVLSSSERRVLGVLIEKAKTTPDNYPMSLNALINGCNQKNNRDPLMNLGDQDVTTAMTGLKQKGYAQQIMGSGRVDKFRHVAYEAWKVDKVQLAILGELLLRGPQTEGELRGRASRMEPIEDLDQLRLHLRQLSQRGLVVYLSPEERRGTTLTHGFHPPDELQRLRSRASAELDAAPGITARPASTMVAPPEWQERLVAIERELAQLRQEVDELRNSR